MRCLRLYLCCCGFYKIVLAVSDECILGECRRDDFARITGGVGLSRSSVCLGTLQ